MNKTALNTTRAQLQVIISAYESHLVERVISGDRSVAASEALAARDVVRNIGMSRVSRTRVERVTKPREDDPRVETATQALVPETQRIISTGNFPNSREERRGSDSLFRNLKDCIPCQLDWDWKDFDWSKLKDLLELDLKSRFAWLLDLEDFLKDRSWINELCRILGLFKDLCPKDVLPLIAMLTAFLMRTLDAIKLNLTGALKDILGMILRPYIAGLEDFLNMFIQFYVDQIQCILNLLITTGEELRDLEIRTFKEEVAAAIGLQVEPSKEEPWRFDEDSLARKSFDLTAKTGRKIDEIVNQDRRRLVKGIANLEFLKESGRVDGVPVVSQAQSFLLFLVAKVRSGIEWVEEQAAKVQDAMIDLLGGEWLITKQNMTFIQDLKAVATIIQILNAIVAIGGIKGELCTEDDVRSVIDIINRDSPGAVIIEEDVARGAEQGNPLLPSTGVSPTVLDERSSPSGQSDLSIPGSGQGVLFSIKKCLKWDTPDESEQLLRYIASLG